MIFCVEDDSSIRDLMIYTLNWRDLRLRDSRKGRLSLKLSIQERLSS